MIVLDTNVLSELMKPDPSPLVEAWLNAQVDVLAITAINVAEILHGIAILQDGKRKRRLYEDAISLFDDEFSGNILPFAEDAAERYASLLAAAKRNGKTVHMPDAQIAAICLVHGARIATRNVRDFELPGLIVINPWAE